MKRFPDFATIIPVIFAILAGTLASCSDTAQRKSEPAIKTDNAQPQNESQEKADLTQRKTEPAEKIEGKWAGTLKISSGQVLRVEFEISRGEDGALAALLNSTDQGAWGVLVDKTTFENNNLRLEVKSIQGIYQGKLREDGLAIEGQWIQGDSLPLELKRAQ